MKESILKYLACPSCGGDIKLKSIAGKDQIEIMDGELECQECSKRFLIIGGVPRFVDTGNIDKEKAATAENFGWQWQHFTQQDERYVSQFLGWIAPVEPQFFKNKIVLEGGCGKGRHTQLAAKWEAKDIIGVDLSSAVETAFAATKYVENAHIIQADIYSLPVKPIFDYAFSVGVLHHLPNPRAGFISIASKLRQGGHLSAWVYGAENNEWITRWISPIRNHITSRINQHLLLHLSQIPTTLLYIITKLIYGPLNNKPWGAKIAQHLFYNDYLNALSRFGWREQHTIVFDHLVAPTAFYISREEFEDWWKQIQADDILISWHNRNSWRGTGTIVTNSRVAT
jgi:SAM-dependent methyltransferase